METRRIEIDAGRKIGCRECRHSFAIHIQMGSRDKIARLAIRFLGQGIGPFLFLPVDILHAVIEGRPLEHDALLDIFLKRAISGP